MQPDEEVKLCISFTCIGCSACAYEFIKNKKVRLLFLSPESFL